MRIIILTITIMLLSANSCYSDEKKKDSSGADSKAATSAPAPVVPQPIQPFKPSKEISADSVISLPTDI